MGRASINCWTVSLPARELFQKSNRSLWMVDKSLLLVLARQDMSKISATAPAVLPCQSALVECIYTLNGHPHKHIVGRAGVVLNTKSDPYSRERTGGGSEGNFLGRRKRDSDLGEITNPGFLRQLSGRRTEESSDGGDDSGDSNHF